MESNLRDANSQFSIGLQIIKDCYGQQQRELTSEIETWRRKSEQQANEVREAIHSLI